ncbi:putative lipid-binding protein At4g00165 [Durio zibethinus]|uniref:Lipid-binding protein At4g00165 n=1 Tax=Durio zibethinus TaxID=66656 RepID=A0A6P6A461_DURZI|nr:putative lipid-binding protein At4g00165 [Durio zibethinus]
MAFRGCKAAALFFLLSISFFTRVSSHTVVPCPPPPKTAPSPPSVPKKPAKCPKDTLKFGVCGSWLGLVHEVIGTPPSKECCTLISGLADLEAAFCLCTAIKANMLGVIKVKIPIALTLLINACGKKVPKGFVCA